MNKKELGRLAEEAAARYLLQQGYFILEKNYRSKKGELDLVAQDKTSLVFVEVRSRKGTSFGLPQETVNWAKQQQVRLMASEYLRAKGGAQRYCRFDVVGVVFAEDDSIKAIELIQDAF